MSGPWKWDDLAQSTRDSIDLQGVDEDELLMRRCSCEERPNGWWLCSYHLGMQDAAEMYADDIDRLRDLIRAADRLVRVVLLLPPDDALAWNKVVGR